MLNSLTTPEPSAESGPAQPARAGLSEEAAALHLSHLFRHSLQQGEIHPLMPVLKAHYGVLGSLTRPSRAPAAALVSTLPVAPIDVALLQQGVASLPALPQAVHHALVVLNDERANLATVVACIEQDQALAARTLRAANSAFYGAPGRVATIPAAVGMLGLRTVAALVTAAALPAQLGAASACEGFSMRPYWRHALTTALLARGLAAHAGADPQVAFAAGLLHDIGVLVLASRFPTQYGQVLLHARQADLPLAVAERALLGLDHGTAGEVLVRHWHLPATIVRALAADPVDEGPNEASSKLVDLLQAADALAHGVEPGGHPDDAIPPLAIAAWARVNPGPSQTAAVLNDVVATVEALADALAH